MSSETRQRKQTKKILSGTNKKSKLPSSKLPPPHVTNHIQRSSGDPQMLGNGAVRSFAREDAMSSTIRRSNGTALDLVRDNTVKEKQITTGYSGRCLDNAIVISDSESDENADSNLASRASPVTFVWIDDGSDNSVEPCQSSSTSALPNPVGGKQIVPTVSSSDSSSPALDFRPYSESELEMSLGTSVSPARSEYAFSEIYGDMGRGSPAHSVRVNGGSTTTAISPFPHSFSGLDDSGGHAFDDVFSPSFGASDMSSTSARIVNPTPSRSNTPDIDVEMEPVETTTSTDIGIVPQIEYSVDAGRTALSTVLAVPTHPHSRPKGAEHFEGFRHILSSSDDNAPSESDEDETTPYLQPVKEGNANDTIQPFDSIVTMDQYLSSDSNDTDIEDRSRPQQPSRRHRPRRPFSGRSRRASTTPMVDRTFRRQSDSESGRNEDPPLVYQRESGAPNIVNKKLPKTPHGRPRRVLVPKDPQLPFVTISMREDVQFFHRKEKFRISDSLPHRGPECHVEEACIVNDTVVIGYDKGPHEVSLVPFQPESIRRLTPLTPHPHRVHEIRGKVPIKAGISSLAPIDFSGSQLRFVSGGYDHWIHLWTVSERRNTFLPHTVKIDVLHSAPVSAMAYREHDRTLLSAAGNRVRIINMDRSMELTKEMVSEHVYHMQVHPNDSNVSILEVKHLDHQIQIYDNRRGGFSRPPCMQFGHRLLAKGKFPHRHTKGATTFSYFVRGFDDGVVKLWDYRNTENVVIKWEQKEEGRVVHTAFSGHDVIALSQSFRSSSEPFLTFIEPRGGHW